MRVHVCVETCAVGGGFAGANLVLGGKTSTTNPFPSTAMPFVAKLQASNGGAHWIRIFNDTSTASEYTTTTPPLSACVRGQSAGFKGSARQ